MYFDRMDICEAYALLECNWHVNGIVRERKGNTRRNMSTGDQLWRMGVKFSPMFDYYYENLSDNGKEIYDNLLVRYGFNEVK
jgi:hypothetical protein